MSDLGNIPSSAELDGFRQEMDPPADLAAQAILDSHNVGGVRDILSYLAQNDSSVDIEIGGYQLPPVVKAYFKDLSHFQFTREQKNILDGAAEIFARHAPTIAFNLAVRSLCKQYAASRSTNVLRMTTLLTQYTDRRVTETFQFVLDVMQEGWYQPTKRGIRSIQMLRLIHALIRIRIQRGMTPSQEGAWDPIWGQPINQEDMVFANNTFSVEVIDGLEQVGVKLSAEEAETYYQAWSLIGRALGVNPALEMPDLATARDLQQRIYDRQFAPNQNGPALAKALIRWLIQVIPIDVSEHSIYIFIKFFNGEDNYWIFEKILDVPIGHESINFHKHVHQEIAGLTETELNHESLVRMSHTELVGGSYSEDAQLHILGSLSLKLLKGIFEHKRGSKSTGFEVDDALANFWGLPGNDGIPTPDMPPLSTPKKKHPIVNFLFSIGTWLLNLYIKIRDFFNPDQK